MGASACTLTFPTLLAHRAQVHGERPAFRHKDLGIWQTWTWSEVNRIARAYAVGLNQLGFKRGEAIAIIGANRPKLYCAILAIQALGGVPVPAFADSTANELAYVLAQVDAKFAVVQEQAQVDKILSVSNKLPELRFVIYDDPRGLREYDHARLRSVDELVGNGEKALNDKTVATWLDNEIAEGKGSDVSIILFTPGTTGRPKGVALSMEGCIKAAQDTAAFDLLTDHDEVFAFLPPAWVGDHYFNYAMALVTGFCVSCPESNETVRQNLREIGPTFFFTSPRFLEGLFSRVMIGMADTSTFKRRLFDFFIDVARQYGERILNHQPIPVRGWVLYMLGKFLIYAPLKNMLGFSRIRVAYTAGEAIAPELFSFYRSLGLNLKQLYGQTEAFFCITAQPDGEARPDTVGCPAPNVQIRVAEDGEVLFKSPGMFLSYVNDEANTAEPLTSDGFMRSGDAGFLDASGHLHIVDRAQDVGRLRDGSLFSPKYIENILRCSPYIKEAVALGDGRDFVGCFINIDRSTVRKWADRNNVVYSVAYGSYHELSGNSRVYDMIESTINELNFGLARESTMAGAQVKRFLILHKEFNSDDGELTHTQTLRREFITQRYRPVIDALYKGDSEAIVATEVIFDDGRAGTVKERIKIRDLTINPPARTVAAK